MVVTLITIWFCVVSVCCGGFWLTTLVLPSLVGIQVVAVWWCAPLDRGLSICMCEVLAPLVSLGTVCLRPGLPQLCHQAILYQHFNGSISRAWGY